MTAKEYLKQYEEAARLARRLKTEYDKEVELIDSIRSALGGDGLPRGGGISKTTEVKAVRLSELFSDYQTAELYALRVKRTVMSTINSIPGEAGSTLYERYINLQWDEERQILRLKTWDEVSKAIGYSKRQTHRFHQDGLAAVQNVIEWHSFP